MVRDDFQKKPADRTLSQLSLPPLPLRPIRTNFNWDIFEHRYPSPPFLQLGQKAFEIFVRHDLLERQFCICVFVYEYLSITLLILALLEL